MIESSRRIRELKEAMRAERGIRIRNRVMAVLGVLKGHSTRTTSDFTDADRRTVQLWVARFDEGDIGGLRDAPRMGGFHAQGTAGSGGWPAGLPLTNTMRHWRT